jgi:hypothetical protein
MTTEPNAPQPDDQTNDRRPDDDEDDDGSGPSSHETSGQFPADEVRETHEDQ